MQQCYDVCNHLHPMRPPDRYPLDEHPLSGSVCCCSACHRCWPCPSGTFWSALARQLLTQKGREIEEALLERYRRTGSGHFASSWPAFVSIAAPGHGAAARSPFLQQASSNTGAHPRLRRRLLQPGTDVAFPLRRHAPYPAGDRFRDHRHPGQLPHRAGELVAYYRAGGNIAYWVLSNSWSHDLLKPLVPTVSLSRVQPAGTRRGGIPSFLAGTAPSSRKPPARA